MSRPVWMGRPHPLTVAAKGVAIAITLALIIVPFWVVVATSLSPDAQVIANGGWSLWPERVSFAAYERMFASGVIVRAIGISVGVTAIGTAVSLTTTTLMAYALSRPGMFAGRGVMLVVLFTFLFPPTMIPSFLVVNELGLRNHYAALVLPVAVSAFNLVILRGSFQGLPAELFESARIDGAGEWRILRHIALPLSGAVLAVIGFFYAVGYWNNFFNAMLYLDDQTRWPLQPVLRQIVLLGDNPDTTITTGAGVAPQTTMMATVVLAVIPVLVAYPFVQRHFTRGVLTGAVKG